MPATADDMLKQLKEVTLKKIKYYLDTTIFNFVFAEGDTEKKDITVKLFKDQPSISNGIYISDEVIEL